MKEKKLLRKMGIELRKGYETEFLFAESKKLQKILFESSIWKESETIAVTYSLPHEINTQLIFERGWIEGKKMLAPITFFNPKEMKFKEISSFEELQESKKGLYEPIYTEGEGFVAEIDLVIVPGLVFDDFGYRIGFGGGFYDRFLRKYDGVSVGLCLSWEKVEKIPHEKFDVRVNNIITQEGFKTTC